MSGLKLNSPLQYVKGVGPKKAEVLAKLGLNEVRDILYYFPRHYLDRSNISPIASLRADESATVIGEIKAHGILYGKGRRYEAILQDESGAISLMFFRGVQYWERTFKKGQVFAASGRVTWFQGHQMIHPELERLEDETGKLIHAGRIIPVYSQTAELNTVGLNSRGMRRVTTFIFDNLSEQLHDYLPARELQKIRLSPLHESIQRIHYPTDRDEIEKSRRRLAFDELLSLQFVIFRNKANKQALIKRHSYGPPGEKLKRLKESLSFKFTAGQKKVIKEIFADLQTAKPMNRMLQGDVGCGKTVVAMAAALYAAENNLQTAFMAPTEILAEQHYRNWKEVFESLGLRMELLTSSLKASRKKEIAESCAAGEIDLLLGTHALIYDYVSFERLGLVIIDEQHRFGVDQRSKLHAKGDNPDLLVMTATPIPRTLALTLYGDLDISTIDGLPPGRKEVRTVWRTQDARDKVYSFVIDAVSKGGQAYIIYPLIEKSDLIELENVEDAYKAVVSGTFEQLRVAIVHGRTKAKEREKILGQFGRGEIDVLMSTTVIEVGLDNPNATVMIVEHAERFGLAQLHQLRGRIGRGEKQATLVALVRPPISEISRKRLEYFVGTNDGFEIAEADLDLRGPGEMLGRRQSGLPELRAAKLALDRDLMEAARVMLEKIFAKDNKLDSGDRSMYNYLQENVGQRFDDLGGG